MLADTNQILCRPRSVEVYVPRDLKPRFNATRNVSQVVVGYELNHAYVVVAALTPDQSRHISVPGIRVIGSIDRPCLDRTTSQPCPLTGHDTKMNNHVVQKAREVEPGPELEKHETSNTAWENSIGLRFAFNGRNNHLSVTLPWDCLCFVVMFDPPNYHNWEHFSLSPILLQSPLESHLNEKSPVASVVAAHLKYMTYPESSNLMVSSGDVLDKLNLLRQVRDGIDRSLGHSHPLSALAIAVAAFNLIRCFFVFLYRWLGLYAVISWSLWLINYKIVNKSLCDMSYLVQLCDMRLRQLAFFPQQFAAYHGNAATAYTGNPASTPYPNLNINNSHYINMHNSLWLICNDMLLGLACHSLLMDNFDAGIDRARHILVQRWATSDLFRLISWISVDNPAGFKLNRELGKFSGDLYVWALRFWKYILSNHFEASLPGLAADKQALVHAAFIVRLGRYLLFLILCGGGLSFFLAFIQDVIVVTTFHVECFYRTSTRLYHLQLEILRLLLQLLRGKKYNVLRDRIDNLNNYSRDSRADSFEIDQLLLGTLVFMVLVLLLPTVSAFYVTFYLLKLAILIALATLETGIIILNLFPLFVVLLKCKNSRRLQGGIRFVFVSSTQTTNCMHLSNQALTYHEIFEPFFLLFSSAAHLRSTAASRFFHGDPIRLDSNYALKRRYLMLPQDPNLVQAA